MPKEGSVAPKERINVTYKPKTNAKEQIELPFKLLMLGNWTMREDDRALEDRKPINIDKDNFAEVMRQQELKLETMVDNRLSGEEGDEMKVSLNFESLKDFEPDKLVRNVPELAKLMEVRNSLKALRGPLGDKKKLRELFREIVGDEAKLKKLQEEVGGAGG